MRHATTLSGPGQDFMSLLTSPFAFWVRPHDAEREHGASEHFGNVGHGHTKPILRTRFYGHFFSESVSEGFSFSERVPWGRGSRLGRCQSIEKSLATAVVFESFQYGNLKTQRFWFQHVGPKSKNNHLFFNGLGRPGASRTKPGLPSLLSRPGRPAQQGALPGSCASVESRK